MTDRRKQSEDWARRMAYEFDKANSHLTFAEFCYEQGKADGVREFAEKIKSHMMMYCQGRLEQQYCALEVIDYIGKLMGEKDFSIDVEKEMAEHDLKIRADERAKTVDECKKIVMAECTTTCEYPFSPNCVECMTNKMEQLKEQTNV